MDFPALLHHGRLVIAVGVLVLLLTTIAPAIASVCGTAFARAAPTRFPTTN